MKYIRLPSARSGAFLSYKSKWAQKSTNHVGKLLLHNGSNKAQQTNDASMKEIRMIKEMHFFCRKNRPTDTPSYRCKNAAKAYLMRCLTISALEMFNFSFFT